MMKVENKFNILLDPLPQSWNGYPIDSDFQTGIQIYWILEDRGLNDYEKVVQASYLLFPGKAPDRLEDLADAVMWFLHGWNTDRRGRESHEKPVMDFQMDQWRIWVAFKRQYQIDLNAQQIHFWVFMALLRNLEECSFTRVADIRSRKITGKMSAEEKRAYAEAKAVYALESPEHEREYTPEEIAQIDLFDAMRRKTKNREEVNNVWQKK